MAAIEVRLRRGTTAEIADFTGADGEMTYDTQTNEVQIHDGSTIGGLSFGGFGSTTSMLFYQTAAPTGWTKDTNATLDNHAMRVVTSTGWTTGSNGATAFNSVFGSGKVTGSHAGTTPSHTHGSVIISTGSPNVGAGGGVAHNGGNTGAGGAGGTHTHTLSLDLKYFNVIRATKD